MKIKAICNAILISVAMGMFTIGVAVLVWPNDDKKQERVTEIETREQERQTIEPYFEIRTFEPELISGQEAAVPPPLLQDLSSAGEKPAEDEDKALSDG